MEYPVRILVVEDSASLLFIYRQILTQAGYIVLEAPTGVRALELIRQESPDILLLDRVLPDIDGGDICARVKQDPATAETYVIMVSGLKTSEEDRVSGLEAGADDYVVKPVGKRELLARIQVAIRLRNATQKLRASEMQFRTLAENSPDYILRVERNGQIRYVNPAAQRLLDSSKASATHASDFTRHLLNNEQLSAQAQAVFATGQSSRIKSMWRHEHGIHHLDTRLVPEFGPGGEVMSILAVTRDYTDFVIAEQEIRRLATVIRQAVDAVQITDAQGRIIYTNAAYSELTGIDGLDAVGRELPGYTYQCPDHDSCRLLQHLTAGAERWQGMVSIQRADGEQRELETTIFPIRDMNGRVTNYAALQRDVTDRRRSEEERDVTIQVAAALRTAISRREVLEVTLDQMMLLTHVTGVAYATLAPRDVEPLQPVTGDEQSSTEAIVECVRGGTEGNVHLRLPLTGQAAGQLLTGPKPALVFASGVETADAQLDDELAELRNLCGWPIESRTYVGIVLKVQDRMDGVLWVACSRPISERMFNLLRSLADMLGNSLERAELYEAIRRYADELEERVAIRTQELAEANEQLRELDRLKSQFVSNVSHELRTPIANLKLYLNLLDRGKAEKREQYEAMLRHSADRLGQLVQDILSLSRLEIAQLQPVEFSDTDLNAVVSQAVEHFHPQAESVGLHLNFSPSPNLPLILGDFNQLSQLVTNLLSNALTYTQQGEVRVQTCLEETDFPCIHT